MAGIGGERLTALPSPDQQTIGAQRPKELIAANVNAVRQQRRFEHMVELLAADARRIAPDGGHHLYDDGLLQLLYGFGVEVFVYKPDGCNQVRHNCCPAPMPGTIDLLCGRPGASFFSNVDA